LSLCRARFAHKIRILPNNYDERGKAVVVEGALSALALV
jgi:hypothetical protein